MKNGFDYSISLRVTHPSWSKEDIAARLKRSPRRAWTVGEPRTTPKGRLLEGHHKESYCSFDITRRVDGEVASALLDTFEALRAFAHDLHELRATGGDVSLFVFWQSNGDTGERFDVDLLRAMAELGIALDLNVFDSNDALALEPVVPDAVH